MFTAPYPPYDPTDKASFSYETVVKRWPVILTGIVNTLHKRNHDLVLQLNKSSSDALQEEISEGTAIIERISGIKSEMGRDKPLKSLPEDGEPHVQSYNDELTRLTAEGKGTWFTAPWLFAECYLYRLLRSFFAQTKYWNTYDPFFDQKQDTFQQSGTAAYQLASMMHEIIAEKDTYESEPEKLGVLFNEMIQICLWGNATDLSLLTNLSPSEIQQLQSAQQSREEFILHNDTEDVWSHIQTLKDARIDWALDNAGYELFTDFVFADFLVTCTPYASRVIFHPKLIPWFVSDVTPKDFSSLVQALSDPSFFPAPPDDVDTAQREKSIEHLRTMVARWQGHIADGTFALAVKPDTPYGPPTNIKESEDSEKRAGFWSLPWPAWSLKAYAPTLFEEFCQSGLVIFKGDLHYRKLTGDVKWPASTPFKEALGPLAGSFPLLSLRTCKADVVVGVDQAVADRLDTSEEQSENRWRVNGKYALISFVPKVA